MNDQIPYTWEIQRRTFAHISRKRTPNGMSLVTSVTSMSSSLMRYMPFACKPRGKSDQSAAGVAYDALVNQLLTLMDGLMEVHNTLVIGLTNRHELMDPALLRPGRFEVKIEGDI